MKKSYLAVLLAGIIMVAVAAVLCYNNYTTNYAESVELGEELKVVKDQIKKLEADGVTQGIEELKALADSLSDRKLDYERPYSYSLILLFAGGLVTAVGAVKLIAKEKDKKLDTKKLTQAALCAALCYIGFTFFKIDIPVGTEKTAFHFGNVFCVLAALLCGGLWGGLSGAVGMTIADLTTSYVTSAPKTFLLKLCIGLIVGLVAHKIFKLSKEHSRKYITGVTIGASAAGMVFNMVADPVVGYFYKNYLLGVPQDLAVALAKLNAVTTAVNAVVAVIAATVIYIALRPVMKKSGFLSEI